MLRHHKKSTLIAYIMIVFLLFQFSIAEAATSDKPITNKVVKKSKLKPKSYHVHGKKYVVMTSAHNYKERGYASWYGKKFHHKRTSSGEKYNMLHMTGAHKSLPLPSYVEVTNERNGRKVIVKINDRGPFSSNRIIDLSYVAAKKLGMVNRGTALVTIKTIDPALAYQDPVIQAQHKAKKLIRVAQRDATTKS